MKREKTMNIRFYGWIYFNGGVEIECDVEAEVFREVRETLESPCEPPSINIISVIYKKSKQKVSDEVFEFYEEDLELQASVYLSMDEE